MEERNEHEPSDYILDAFLAKHGVKVDFLEFGVLLGKLRMSFAAEAAEHDAKLRAAGRRP